MGIFNHFQDRYNSEQEEMSIQEYLDLCLKDNSVYATTTKLLLNAVGEPKLIDTSLYPRLRRIFSNKIIKRYSAFKEFFGMEECIEQIGAFFRHSAQA